jgi:hypothetical protein
MGMPTYNRSATKTIGISRWRILLSLLTFMIAGVTLVSLTVSLHHVHSNSTIVPILTDSRSAFQRESLLRRQIPVQPSSARTTHNGRSAAAWKATTSHDGSTKTTTTTMRDDEQKTSAETTTTTVSPALANTHSVTAHASPGDQQKAQLSALSLPVATGFNNATHPLSQGRAAVSVSSSSSQHEHHSISSANPMSMLSAAVNQTEPDVLCFSCRYGPIGPNKNIPCVQRMQLKMDASGSNNSSSENGSNNTNNISNTTMTLAEAGRNIAVRRPAYCGRCDPDQCSAADKHYWRFDAAGPTELTTHAAAIAATSTSSTSASSAISSRTHYLQSIGAEARLPVSALKNLTAFFAHGENIYPAKDYLFEFNPSLVQLPASQIPNVGVSGKEDDKSDTAVYLASFRVSNMHNCVIDPDTMLRMVDGNWPRRKAQVIDYLGLALLRADLTIIADTVVDAKEFVHKMQDPRLFVLHDQIYVGSYHRMTPLWLVPPSENIVPSNATIQLANLWESSMKITLRSFGACTKDREIQRKGKNLNFFVDAENRTMMEMFPKGPKEEIELGVRCTKSAEEDPPGTFVFPNKSAVPLPSFGTVEELDLARERIWDPAITGDRGSYCCVPITVKGQQLLLGIAHSKTRYNHKQGTDAKLEGQIQANHFFSSFYAIQDRAPYTVAAHSGKFCLGFAQDKDESDNPYTTMNVVPLQLMGKTFNCPRIHFVTGMVEKADDPSKVIISYGINDCVPRMIVVDKAEIIQMLFDGPRTFSTF